MAKKVLTYEDVKQMFPKCPYVLATWDDIPMWVFKTKEEALKRRNEELRKLAIMMKVVDVRIL